MQILERNTLLSRMIQTMRARQSEITYFGPGPVRAFLYALAVEIQHLYYQLFKVEERLSVTTARTTDLDLRAAERGLTRRGPNGSSVVLTIRGPAGAVIAASPLLQAQSGTGVTFQVTGAITLAPEFVGSSNGIARVIASALTTGYTTNVPVGSVTTVSNLAALSITPPLTAAQTLTVTNEVIGQGGRDQETDGELRTRTIDILGALNQGTRAFYIQQAQQINPTISRVFVSRSLQQHYVTVSVITAAGAGLTAPDKTALGVALSNVSPVQSQVQIADITFVSIDVVFTCSLKSGYTLAQVTTAVAQSLASFLNWSIWPFQQAVQADDLLSICSTTAGVDSLKVYSFSPNTDTPLGAAQLPRLNKVIITDIATQQTVTVQTAYSSYPVLVS